MHTITPGRELPLADSSLSVRLVCCDADRPARVISAAGDVVTIAQPLHPCGAAAMGDPAELVWSTGGDVRTVAGEIVSVRGRPPRWGIRVTASAEAANRRSEPRYEFGAVAAIWFSRGMVPARVVDRSRSGLGCRVGGGAPLKQRDVVTVELAGETLRALVVRVRPAGRTLDVGLKILEATAHEE